MSRHRLPSRRRPSAVPGHRPGTATTKRTRLAITLGAVVVILAVAAFIGSSQGGTEDSAPAGADRPTQATDAGFVGADGAPTVETGVARDAFDDADGAATADRAASEEAVGGAGGVAVASPDQQAGNPVEAKVVRTGSVDVVVADGSFEKAVGQLTTIAAGAGGFVSASQTSALADTPVGTVTLRVPADRFDDVLGQVRDLGDVESADTASQDVTGEYSDVEARLSALKAERDQITLILGRAESIPDILSVRDRLSMVQAEIEQLQGRQQLLDDQTSLSTLTVGLREEGDRTVTSPPEPRSGPSRLWHDVTDRFTDGGRSIALGLASMAPWLILGLLLFLPARALWRRTAPPAADLPSPGVPDSEAPTVP